MSAETYMWVVGMWVVSLGCFIAGTVIGKKFDRKRDAEIDILNKTIAEMDDHCRWLYRTKKKLEQELTWERRNTKKKQEEK